MGTPILKDSQTLTGHSPEHPVLTGPAFSPVQPTGPCGLTKVKLWKKAHYLAVSASEITSVPLYVCICRGISLNIYKQNSTLLLYAESLIAKDLVVTKLL